MSVSHPAAHGNKTRTPAYRALSRDQFQDLIVAASSPSPAPRRAGWMPTTS